MFLLRDILHYKIYGKRLISDEQREHLIRIFQGHPNYERYKLNAGPRFGMERPMTDIDIYERVTDKDLLALNKIKWGRGRPKKFKWFPGDPLIPVDPDKKPEREKKEFRAIVKHQGKTVHIGRYVTQEERDAAILNFKLFNLKGNQSVT